MASKECDRRETGSLPITAEAVWMGLGAQFCAVQFSDGKLSQSMRRS